MKTLSPALQAHLASECGTLAWLVKITRADGLVLGFTDHDRNLALDGVTYRADSAVNPSALLSGGDLAPDNLAVNGILDDTALAAADIEAGRYDHARIDVFICNWADLSQGALQLRRGWVGEVTLRDGRYTAELRGLHDLLQREFGDYYTAECRHDLGDARCMVALGSLTASGAASAATDKTHFNDTGRTEAEGWFSYGLLTWTGGANQGLTAEVKVWDASLKQFTLRLPMPYAIAPGDAYTVQAGCDKRAATCKNKFANLINFGGFPHMPGVDKILNYPDGKA